VGTTQPYTEWDSGVISLNIRTLWCESEHSFPSSAKIKNEYKYTSTTLYDFTASIGTILPLLITSPILTSAVKSNRKHGWFINEE